jgi:hypothetical protein
VGVEYEAKPTAPLAQTTIRALFDALEADGRWQRIRRSDGELALANAGETLNPKWPERLAIHANEAQIYVVFHASTKSESHDFLSAVSAILQSLGVSSEFDQL